MNFINRPRTAILIGATGLVGTALLDMLTGDISFQRIILLTRRPINIVSAKVEVVETDFVNLNKLNSYFKETDVVYCCIGTTIKKAGSNKAFRLVDYDIPVHIAKIASENNVRSYIVISSLGADPNSSNFYLKTKGEMEQAIIAYKFNKLAFVRPSLLLGHRKEFRFFERLLQIIVSLLSPFMVGPFKKYSPIHDSSVAKAMIQISNSASNQKVYESSELEWLGGGS